MKLFVSLIVVVLSVSSSLVMAAPAHNAEGPVSPNVSLSDDHWVELGPEPVGSIQNCCLDGHPHSDWGHAPLSGRVTAIAVNSSNTANIYLGSSGGGVWKTMDGGQTWTPITDDQPSLAIGSIAISSDTKTIYVGTGDPNHSVDSYAGAGLLRSSDGGQTWTVLGASTFKDAAISGILLFPSDPSRIILSTTWASCCHGIAITAPSSVGLFLSTDGGNTWQETVSTINPTEQKVYNWDGFASLIAHPTNSSIAYAGDFAGNTWETNDKGASWSKILYAPQSVVCLPSLANGTSLENEGSGCRVQLAVTPSRPESVFGAWTNSTSDFIGSWEYNTQTRIVTVDRLPPTPPDHSRLCDQCNYDLYLYIDPTNPNVKYLGTLDVYRSDDGGLTWTDLAGYTGQIHPDQHAFAFLPNSPSTIFAGNDGGMWKSTNRGITWSSLNQGIGTILFRTIAGSGDKVLGGAQDNSCLEYPGSGTSWTEYPWAGDGGWVGFDPKNPSFMYCESYDAQYFNSSDAGSTWHGVSLPLRGVFIFPMTQDRENPGTLYMGGLGLDKSSDHGNTWYRIVRSDQSLVTTIATSPTKGGVVYFGQISQSGASVLASIDSGSTFSTALSPTSGSISSIAVDPNNHIVAYAAFRERNAGLVKLTGNGGTWTSTILSGPPGENINSLAVVFGSGTIIAGTDHGVYYSTDGGSSWSLLGRGLPNVVVRALDIVTTTSGHSRANKLIAGTYGRGAWTFDLGTMNIPDFSIVANPSAVTVNTGVTASATITVTADQGLNGPVTLTAVNSACDISPKTLTGSGSATLSCTFLTSGKVIVTVTATSPDWSHTSTVTFNVQTPVLGAGNLPSLALGATALIIVGNWVAGAIIASVLVVRQRRRAPLKMPVNQQQGTGS